MSETTRIITVGSSRRIVPYIRIVNNYLLACGFKVGDKISVEYKLNQLILTKII